jgi:hypothetical protein
MSVVARGIHYPTRGCPSENDLEQERQQTETD